MGADKADNVISFGPFRLLPSARLVEKDGEPLHIGGRALDILFCLVGRAGEVVSKKDLVAHVWPGITVDEGSLRFHITALRKALGDGQHGARYVTNVPGRGYSFVAQISRSAPPQPASVATSEPRRSFNLPARLARMIGRNETIEKIAQELLAFRFVSVVGPGGIGKTTVAIATAHALLADFDGAVCFVDLGPLNDESLAASAVATSLGLMVNSNDAVPGLLAYLQDKRMLLVLDSCEHVIRTVAALAESIFNTAPSTYVIATSRESLRVEGERVHRLFPLSCPPPESDLLAADALSFAAVQLFVERASAGSGNFRLTDSDAPLVAEICRKLDGIALAIELAAGRADAYGIQGIATHLDSRFGLLWRGRRTALPRHQTLTAALDWSYNLLTDAERMMLRRLAIFVGRFTLEAALAVGSPDDDAGAEGAEVVAGLVAKSLVAVSAANQSRRYRLLDTTRAYLLTKLRDHDETDSVAEQHATYFCILLESSDADASIRPGGDGFAAHREHLDNIRAALDWSFSPHGDLTLGTRLAAAGTRFLLDLSLLTECHRWAEHAIALLDEQSIGTQREMELQASFGVSLMFTQGNKEEARAALERSLALAETLGDALAQLRILRGLHLYMTRIGNFRGALAVGQRSEAVARLLNDAEASMMADWMVGVAQHLIGDQADVVSRCESAMTRTPVSMQANMTHLGYDHRIIALVALARCLWLTGNGLRAAQVARFVVAEAEHLEQPLTLCIAIIWTTYVFLWIGDWLHAEALIEQLIAHATRHSLGPYRAVGSGLKGELALRQGDPASGVALLRGCLAALRPARHDILAPVFAASLAEGLADIGQHEEAQAAIDDAIAQVESIGESFALPDMLRIKAQIIASSPQSDPTQAEAWLLRAIEGARRQSAPGWELRAATALARLWLAQGRRSEARRLLAPILAACAEGQDSVDFTAARDVLKQIGGDGAA